MIVFNAFVPAYDFSPAVASVQGVRIEHDYKAWYELMRRFNYMFGLGIDLSELDRQAEELTRSIDEKIAELEKIAAPGRRARVFALAGGRVRGKALHAAGRRVGARAGRPV